MGYDFEQNELRGQIGERVAQVLLALDPFVFQRAPEACSGYGDKDNWARLVISTKPVEATEYTRGTLESFQKKEADLLVLTRKGTHYRINQNEISEEELDGSLIRVIEVKYQPACIGKRYKWQNPVTAFRQRHLAQIQNYVAQEQIPCDLSRWMNVGGESLFVGKWINTIKNNSAQQIASQLFRRKNNAEVERMIQTAERWMVFVLPAIDRSIPMMVVLMTDRDFIEAFEANKHLLEQKSGGYLMPLSVLPKGKYKVSFIAYSEVMDQNVKEKGVQSLIR